MPNTVELWKCAFCIVILAVTLVAGWSPMCTTKCKENPRLLGILNSFAGGVFLAIAFVHILPEACNTYYNMRLETILDEHHHIKANDLIDPHA